MLQIKTIHNTDPADFDEEVNTALADGWKLARRLTGPGPDFVAELERETIPEADCKTEAERTCVNCRYFYTKIGEEPCIRCSKDLDKWEAVL